MSTEDIISARRDAAIQKWTEAVFAMYPFETTGFIRTQRDQFANPVGHATRAAGEQIYDAVTGRDVDMEKSARLCGGTDPYPRGARTSSPNRLSACCTCTSPCFVNCSLRTCWPPGDVQGFLDMGDRLDTLCLMAFNLYLADREQVYAERVAQQRREASQIRRWAARHGLWKIRTGNRPCFLFPFRNPFYCGYGLDMSNFKPGVR